MYQYYQVSGTIRDQTHYTSIGLAAQQVPLHPHCHKHTSNALRYNAMMATTSLDDRIFQLRYFMRPPSHMQAIIY